MPAENPRRLLRHGDEREMDTVVNLNVHGIGVPTRAHEPGEADVWITLDQFRMVLDTIADRSDVHLTFDDGNLSDIEIALPLLVARGMSAEFFVCPGLFAEPGRLSGDGIRELLKAGMRIGSHGWSHVDWRRADQAQILQELQTSRTVLREIVGDEVDHMSIPFGSYDRRVLRELRRFGVSRVYTSDGGSARAGAWLQARTSLRREMDRDWLARVVDRRVTWVGSARSTAARTVKRYRGEPKLRAARREDPTAQAAAEIAAEPGREAGDTVVRPSIAIVIVTYNSADVLGGCLASLPSGTAGVDVPAVVVVDNASTDRTLAIATDSGDVQVRTVELGVNVGYAAGINAGLAVLDTRELDAVLVLNPDCRLRPGSVAALAASLKAPQRGIAVPRLLNPDGTLQPSLRRAPALRRSLAEAALGSMASQLSLGEIVTVPTAYDEPGSWAWATGAALLLSTRMLDEVGPWDESFLLYSEETEYALRAADYGWQLWYEPSATIEHVGGTSHLKPDLAGLLASNRVRLFRLRHGAAAGAMFYAVEAVGAGLRAAVGRQQSRAALAVLVRPSRRIRKLPAET
jgi:GT2 family glycosyltransferase/peptidoglycan/xylan/chitin deacetylase (PgdA/CDA1 family)